MSCRRYPQTINHNSIVEQLILWSTWPCNTICSGRALRCRHQGDLHRGWSPRSQRAQDEGGLPHFMPQSRTSDVLDTLILIIIKPTFSPYSFNRWHRRTSRSRRRMCFTGSRREPQRDCTCRSLLYFLPSDENMWKILNYWSIFAVKTSPEKSLWYDQCSISELMNLK